MINKDKVIEAIRDCCLQNTNIIAVYLFGSFARGTFTQRSDIDIALMLNSKLDKFEAFNLKLEVGVALEEILDREVDVVIFSKAHLRLKHQIIKGDLIIGKDNKFRVKEESRAVREYLDMRYSYDIYEKKMGKEFLNG